MVIVPTGIIGNYLRKIGVTTKLRKVPTGIKTDRFCNGDSKWLRQLFNISPEDKVLLFVGRLGKEKNIGLLLESFKLVKNELKNTNLVLVGGGPQEEELRANAKSLGIGDSVFFTGLLSPEEVTNCYAGSDIFVFSSMTETQGLVIAEAKAAGLPVVAVGANGVTEMVEDGIDGYLTNPDPNDLAERICYLLKNDDVRMEMGKRAREHAENLSAAKCTQQLLNCYMELTEDAKNARIDKI